MTPRRPTGKLYQSCPRCLRRLEVETVEAIPAHNCPHNQGCARGSARLREGEESAACARCDARHRHRRAGSAGWDRVLVLDFTGPEREAGGVTFYAASSAALPDEHERPAPSVEVEPPDPADVDDLDAEERELRKQLAGVRKGRGGGEPRKAPEPSERREERRRSVAEGASSVLAALRGARGTGSTGQPNAAKKPRSG